MAIKRLRVIVGPNGSGKSTLKRELESLKEFSFHEYFNADDLLKSIARLGYYEFCHGESFEALRSFAENSAFSDDVKKLFFDGSVTCESKRIYFSKSALNAHAISMLAGLIYEFLIEKGVSFSFETVFSSPQKVALLKRAAERGYKVYIYCIATETPLINKGRVESRVEDKGHDVPVDKIFSRYPKSLENTFKAMPFVYRAFFFDNSKIDTLYIASYDKEKNSIELKVDAADVPNWFKKYFLDKSLKY